jgi:hypothetical protein
LIYAVLDVLWRRPEEPIVFFPTIYPFHPAIVSIGALMLFSSGALAELMPWRMGEKSSKILGLGVAIVFATMWVNPMLRTVCMSPDHEGVILACYGLSLAASLLFAWFLSRGCHVIFLLPGMALAYAATELIWIQPERGDLFWFTPWQSTIISIMALGFFFYTRYLTRRI